MPDSTLSNLPAQNNLESTDIFHIVRSGTDYKIAASDFVSPGDNIGIFDAIVDGVGGVENTYASIESALASDKKSLKITASLTLTQDVLLSDKLFMYIAKGVSITTNTFSFDCTNTFSCIVIGYDKTSKIISSYTSDNTNLFKNTSDSSVFIKLSSIEWDNSATTSNNCNIATSCRILIDNCTIKAGNATNSGVYFANDGCFIKNSEINSIGSNAENVLRVSKGFCNNVTFTLENMSLSVNSFLQDGITAQSSGIKVLGQNTNFSIMGNLSNVMSAGNFNINIICNNEKTIISDSNLYGGDLDLNGQSDLSINNIVTTGKLKCTSAVANCRISGCYFVNDSTIWGSNTRLIDCNFYVLNVDSSSSNIAIIGCFASEFNNTTTDIIKVGNGNVIGNIYDGNDGNFYDAFVGTGQAYSTIAQALAANKKRILVLNNTTEPSNWSPSDNTFIEILNANVNLENYQIDMNNAPKASFKIKGLYSTESLLTRNPTSNDSPLFINDTSSNVIDISDISYDNSATTSTATEISEEAIIRMTGISFILPNQSGGGVTLSDYRSYIIDSEFIGPGTNCDNVLTLRDGSYAKNINFIGSFNPTTQIIEINNVRSRIDGLTLFLSSSGFTINNDGGSIYQVNQSGSNDLNINCNASGFYLEDIPGIDVLTIDASVTNGTIISCTASSYVDNSSGAIIKRVANGNNIGNDYSGSGTGGETYFDAFVGPTGDYSEVNLAVADGKRNIAVIGTVSESSNIDCSTDISIFISENSTLSLNATTLNINVGSNNAKIYGQNCYTSKLILTSDLTPGADSIIKGLSSSKSIEFSNILIDNQSTLDNKTINNGGKVIINNCRLKQPNGENLGFIFDGNNDHIVNQLEIFGGGNVCNKPLVISRGNFNDIFINLTGKTGTTSSDAIIDVAGNNFINMSNINIMMTDAGEYRVNLSGNINNLLTDISNNLSIFIASNGTQLNNLFIPQGTIDGGSSSSSYVAISNVTGVDNINVNNGNDNWSMNNINNPSGTITFAGDYANVNNLTVLSSITISGNYNTLINIHVGSTGGTETINITGGTRNGVVLAVTETAITDSGTDSAVHFNILHV